MWRPQALVSVKKNIYLDTIFFLPETSACGGDLGQHSVLKTV
jgi:hypothetical protein